MPHPGEFEFQIREEIKRLECLINAGGTGGSDQFITSEIVNLGDDYTFSSSDNGKVFLLTAKIDPNDPIILTVPDEFLDIKVLSFSLVSILFSPSLTTAMNDVSPNPPAEAQIGQLGHIGAYVNGDLIIADYPNRLLTINGFMESGISFEILTGDFGFVIGSPTPVWATIFQQINDIRHPILENRIIINSNTDLAILNVIDSTKEYFIDGVVDIGAINFLIPSGGITLTGYKNGVSKLISSEDNYIMFQSDLGGAGDINIRNVEIEVTGTTNAKVFDIVAQTGDTEITHLENITFTNCIDLGILDSYHRGLEVDVLRKGGTPSLTFHGTWTGGYEIKRGHISGIDNTMITALFVVGINFSMEGRFEVTANIDLGTLALLTDFSPAEFTLGALEFVNCIVSRNGVIDDTDTTINPNIAEFDDPCNWKTNIGIKNTRLRISITVVTSTPNFAGEYEFINVDDDIIGGVATVFFPPAANTTGVPFTVKKRGTTANVIIDVGGDLIDGAPTAVLTIQDEAIDFVSDGITYNIR